MQLLEASQHISLECAARKFNLKKYLYYSNTYYANYGGRTHANEFFRALKSHRDVSSATLFSFLDEDTQVSRSFLRLVQDILKTLTQKLKHTFIPKQMFAIYKYQYPSKTIYRQLKAIIKREQIDVLILRHMNSFKYLKWLHKDCVGLKTVVEFNGSAFSEGDSNIPFVNYWRKQEIQCLEKADYISVVSEELRQHFLNTNINIDESIIVNPNGVDVGRFKPLGKGDRYRLRNKLNIPTEAIVFGYVGGMEKFGRLPEVVERMGLLRLKGFVRIFMIIVGDGEDLREVISMKNKYESLTDKFIYCNESWIPYEKIPFWLNSFDVGMFPFSNSFGSPQKLFEYAAFGLPIIGPAVPALTIDSGSELCEYLVKQDGSNFEESIIAVYKNIDLLKSSAKRVRKIVTSKYTWDANVSRIIDKINSPITKMD